jgi:hypothetical protein
MDPSGKRGCCIYAKDDVGGYVNFRIYANRYNAETNTWNGPEIIDNGTNAPYNETNMAIDKDYNIFGYWRDAVDLFYNFYH